MKQSIKELKTFFVLWSTQSLSQLGSAMTSFALALWLYGETGSALQTALLSVCSYAPYVVMSVFAGALSDRWDKKKVMLACDSLAALSTIAVLVLLKGGWLAPWHMYLLNALSGLMNTVQQPASDVAMTLITPPRWYQKTSGLRSLSNSLVTILNPILATAVFAFAGMDGVIFLDLLTFGVAFLALLLGVRLPQGGKDARVSREPFWATVRSGLGYLGENRMILLLILFLAGVNFVASAFDAALPALILPKENGGEAGDFADHAVLFGHGKLFAGLFPQPLAVVPGAADWLAAGAPDERQPGRGAAQDHPRGDAGACVRLPELPAVLHHPPGAAGRRRPH